MHREVRGEATAKTGPAPGETLKCLRMSTEVKPRAQEVTTQTHVRMKLLKTSDEETIWKKKQTARQKVTSNADEQTSWKNLASQ